VTAPAWPGYTLRQLPRGLEAKWEAVKAERIPDPTTDQPNPPLSVNAWVNRAIAYAADPRDHWQGPIETLRRKTGDCEDYAILKRAILIARGWPASRLALVVGDDLIRRQAHALLWADGQLWDSLSDHPIMPAELAGDFIPHFAFGLAAWAYERGAE